MEGEEAIPLQTWLGP